MGETLEMTFFIRDVRDLSKAPVSHHAALEYLADFFLVDSTSASEYTKQCLCIHGQN